MIYFNFIGQTQSAEFAFGLPPKKQTQRSRLGRVGHDTKVGAKLGAGVGGVGAGLAGAASGSLGGAISGASYGLPVGVGRALLTPRKKKTLMDRFRK